MAKSKVTPAPTRKNYILVTHKTVTKQQRKTLRSYGFDVDNSLFDETMFIAALTEKQVKALRAKAWVLSVEEEVTSYTTQS